MSRYYIPLLLFCCFSLSVSAQPAPELQILAAGQIVEREIVGGQSHTYQIPLTAGQFVRFRLEQRAINATLILTAPEDKQLTEMDLSNIGEQETIFLEAAVTGTYRLIVRGLGAATVRGSYLLEMAAQATATELDRKRVTAQGLLLEANALANQGVRMGKQAIEKLQQVIPLLREIGEPRWTACALLRTGLVYIDLSQVEKAIAYIEQALAISRELKDRAGEGAILYELAFAYERQGQVEKAIVYYEPSLAITREVKDRKGEASTLGALGVAYSRLSQVEKAIAYYVQSLAIGREIKEQKQVGIALSNLGGAYEELSQFEKAIEYHEQALAIKREVKDRRGEGITLGNLGLVYSKLKRYEKAAAYHEQALAIRREVKDRRGEGISLSNLGLAYKNLSQVEKAIEYYEQALAIAREIKDRQGEGTRLNNLGAAYRDLSRYEKAIEYLEQALAINREMKDRRGEVAALGNLGAAYRDLSRYEKAIEYLEQALAIARDVKDRSSEFTTLSSLAHAERARGNLVSARSRFEECLAVAEWLRNEAGSPESRASLLADIQIHYQRYTDVLMRLHQTEPTTGLAAMALETSERQRARSLLDLLTESHTDLRQGVDAALLERERTLAKQLSTKAQTQTKSPEAAAALKREISQLENEYERVQVAIRKASPHYAALMQPQPLKLPEIQQQLDADTLLLEYALGPERSYLWAITKDSLTSYELPKGEDIKQRALQVYELLTARSTPNPDETPTARRTRLVQAEANLPAAAQALSRMILGPVAAQLGNKRLVIVADGALQYVPFAMLPEPVVGGRWSVVGKEEKNNRPSAIANSVKAATNRPPTTDHRPPLIVKHEIINLPSASALAIQRAELAGRKPAPKALAVLADPVFDRTDPRLKASAKPAEANLIAANLDARGFGLNAKLAQTIKQTSQQTGTEDAALRLQRLPGTRQEAERILALAPPASRRQLVDFAASRATATDPELGQYRIVHFATHGFLNSLQPELSGIVLSLVDEQGRAQEGFLLAHEIYNLKLPAELVVLSACETGLGKDVKGEGLVGLTRGFMYAGAARIVVSLWSVNDRATADLMTRFYQKMLQRGARPAAALRAAQIEMWQQKQWQSPFYWAPFVMQGEWR
ncbi:MAG: CHAT domain-containing protein [Blastocatellia bacterium]|nr:CHAT domain-containing protein [Blastocatellia bacterium]